VLWEDPEDRVQPVVSALPHWAQRVVVAALRPLAASPEPLDSAEGLQPLDPGQEAVAAAPGSMAGAGPRGLAEVAVWRRDQLRERLDPAEVEIAERIEERPGGQRAERQEVAAALWAPLSAAVWAEVWTAVWNAIETAAEFEAESASAGDAEFVVCAQAESEGVAEWRSFEWASSSRSSSAR